MLTPRRLTVYNVPDDRAPSAVRDERAAEPTKAGGDLKVVGVPIVGPGQSMDYSRQG